MGQDLVKQEERAERVPIAAGGTVKAIVPQSFDEMYRLAGALVAAGITPEGLDDHNKVMIALMAGAEAGLSPMASVQGIMIVNKRPSIWGDAALALVRASGLCEWVEEKIEGEGDKAVAVCTIKRKSEEKAIVRTFSHQDAKEAALLDKNIWKKYRKRMLQMRARAWALRDGFADVLKGLHIVEEQRDIEPAQNNVIAPPAPKDEEEPAKEEVIDAIAEEVTHTAEVEPAASSEAAPVDDGPPGIPDEDEEEATPEQTAAAADAAEIAFFVEGVIETISTADRDFDLETYWIETVLPRWDEIDPPDKAFIEKKKAEAEKRLKP